MRRNDAFPSKYLAKEDFPKPALLTIETVVEEDVKSERGNERKAIIYFKEMEKSMILNGTNWDVIQEYTGKDDSEEWSGTQIVVYHEPSVMFGGKRVGGIRMRPPRPKAAEHTPPPTEEEPPPIEDDSIPF